MLGIKHFIPYCPGHLAPCQPRSITIGDEKLPGYEPPALDRHAAETRNNHKPEVSGEPIYLALGVTADGERDVLGLWAGEHGDGEGAKFWLRVLSEIKNRGVEPT